MGCESGVVAVVLVGVVKGNGGVVEREVGVVFRMALFTVAP